MNPVTPLRLNLSSENLQIFFGLVCTIAILSILYRENKVYRLFEHIFIGLAIGYGVGQNWNIVLHPEWWDRIALQGKWWWMFPMLPALMYYFIYSKRYFWISRLIVGFSFGLGVGWGFKAFITANMPQIYSSLKDLTLASAPYLNLSNVVFTIGFISTMTYFYFSFEHKHKSVARTAGLGRWFIMIYLGTVFGTTVMGRMAIFIERLRFILNALHISVR